MNHAHVASYVGNAYGIALAMSDTFSKAGVPIANLLNEMGKQFDGLGLNASAHGRLDYRAHALPQTQQIFDSKGPSPSGIVRS